MWHVTRGSCWAKLACNFCGKPRRFVYPPRAVLLVSPFAPTSRLVLGQEVVDDKSNEITVIPALWSATISKALWPRSRPRNAIPPSRRSPAVDARRQGRLPAGRQHTARAKGAKDEECAKNHAKNHAKDMGADSDEVAPTIQVSTWLICHVRGQVQRPQLASARLVDGGNILPKRACAAVRSPLLRAMRNVLIMQEN
jgi:hypothetical protein